MTPREDLTELIADSMALRERVRSGLAASPNGYRPPEDTGETGEAGTG